MSRLSRLNQANEVAYREAFELAITDPQALEEPFSEQREALVEACKDHLKVERYVPRPRRARARVQVVAEVMVGLNFIIDDFPLDSIPQVVVNEPKRLVVHITPLDPWNDTPPVVMKLEQDFPISWGQRMKFFEAVEKALVAARKDPSKFYGINSTSDVKFIKPLDRYKGLH